MNSSLPILETTITHDTVSERTWDAVVVGAGVAGTTIAQRLAARGHGVLLVEKKQLPRYKVCGSCLNARSLHYLDELGVLDTLRAHGAPSLSGLSLYAGQHHAALSLPNGLAVSRSVLDYELARSAINAGAHFLSGTMATLPEESPSDLRSVTLSFSGTTITAHTRLVIAADGLGGKLLAKGSDAPSKVSENSYIGLGAQGAIATSEQVPGQIAMHCGRWGYVGMVRIENDQLAVAAAVHPKRLKDVESPSELIQEIFEDVGQPLPENIDQWKWHGTPMLTRRPRRVSGSRLVAVGDAAGYIEPFTGEGMAWALESAEKLDTQLARTAPEEWVQAALYWEHAYRRELLPRRIWCRGITAALRYPRITASGVYLLSRAPFLSHSLIATLNHSTRS